MSIVVRLRTTADAARIGEVTPPPDLFIAAADEIERLQADNRRWSKVADERSKENCALRQLLRDARDHVPWDVLKRIDAALGASRAEQEVRK